MHYNIFDLSTLPLSGSVIVSIAVQALQSAKIPQAKICDCPFNLASTQEERYMRTAWRSIFRKERGRLMEENIIENTSSRQDMAA